MMEPDPNLPPVSEPMEHIPVPRKRQKKTARTIVAGVIAVVGLYLLYSVWSLVLFPNRSTRQIYLVPRDAALVIQTDNPYKDWTTLARSEPWQALKKAESFAEINENIELLDSIMSSNKTLLSLVGKRDMTISLHKTGTKQWDFLIVVDLKKISKLDILKDQVETVFKLTGFEASTRAYKAVSIIEMKDNGTGDILYTAFVDNHFIVSYTPKLVEASIDERENPEIGLDPAFLEMERLVSGKGLCRVFVNYRYLPDFLAVYMGKKNDFLDAFSGSMDYAGLFFDADKHRFELKGHTLLSEISDPYVSAILTAGRHRMRAHDILSARTAFYTNIGFDKPSEFISRLETAYGESDPGTYDAFKSAQTKIEKYFDISLQEHFLSWMSGEFALAQAEAGLLGYEPEQILAVRAKNITDARKNMEHIEKRIRRRSPIKIKSVDYKGYDIHYVEMKGFFRLFFGSLFERFEKPFYTYVGDYVVFSNTSAALLSFVEDYEQKNTLGRDREFKKAVSNATRNSSIFTYVDIHKFYPQLKSILDAETWNDLENNREVLHSFPYLTFQVVGNNRQADLQLTLDYKAYQPVEAPPDAEDDPEDDNMSDRQLMSELKRFYVEKFEGNVWREFYEDGSLKSESEVKNGKRHGRYREFYESGKLKSRGRYSGGVPKGTWKYYTEEGKFDRKEKL